MSLATIAFTGSFFSSPRPSCTIAPPGRSSALRMGSFSLPIGTFSAPIAGAATGVTLGDVASRNFTIVGEDAVVFDVINRMWRKGAVMAVVVRGRGPPHAEDVAGVITKEHVADSVAASVRVYPGD